MLINNKSFGLGCLNKGIDRIKVSNNFIKQAFGHFDDSARLEKQMLLTSAMWDKSRAKYARNVYYVTDEMVEMSVKQGLKMQRVLKDMGGQDATILMGKNRMVCATYTRGSILTEGSFGAVQLFVFEGDVLRVMVSGELIEKDGVISMNIIGGEDSKKEAMAHVAYGILFILCLMKYGKTDVVIVNGGQKKAIRGHYEPIVNHTGVKVTYVDSLWLREIVRNEEFGVRGHFRLQPYGHGRSEKKLIYIAPFIKHGYHRRSGKDLYEAKLGS